MTDSTEQERKRAAEVQAQAKREERDALASAVESLEGNGGKDQRPEALRQFAESAREGEESPKPLTADRKTAPRPASNRDKHEVATRILHDGAEGEHPDPKEEGADRLPDRIVDRG
jgi:hypothetical protein